MRPAASRIDYEKSYELAPSWGWWTWQQESGRPQGRCAAQKGVVAQASRLFRTTSSAGRMPARMRYQHPPVRSSFMQPPEQQVIPPSQVLGAQVQYQVIEVELMYVLLLLDGYQFKWPSHGQHLPLWEEDY